MVCLRLTLRGDGVLGAGGGVGLGAVATGVLQGVPAALLLVHAQAPGQHHGQVAGGRGHVVSVLGEGEQRQLQRTACSGLKLNTEAHRDTAHSVVRFKMIVGERWSTVHLYVSLAMEYCSIDGHCLGEKAEAQPSTTM